MLKLTWLFRCACLLLLAFLTIPNTLYAAQPPAGLTGEIIIHNLPTAQPTHTLGPLQTPATVITDNPAISLKSAPVQVSQSAPLLKTDHDCEGSASEPNGLTMTTTQYTRHFLNVAAALTYHAPGSGDYELRCDFQLPDGGVGYTTSQTCTAVGFPTLQHLCVMPVQSDPTFFGSKLQLGDWTVNAYVNGALIDQQVFNITTDPAIDPHPEFNIESLLVKKDLSDTTDTLTFYTSQLASHPDIFADITMDYYHHPFGLAVYRFWEYPENSGIFNPIIATNWARSDAPIYLNQSTIFTGLTLNTDIQNEYLNLVLTLSDGNTWYAPIGHWRFYALVDQNNDLTPDDLNQNGVIDEGDFLAPKDYTLIDDVPPATTNYRMTVVGWDQQAQTITVQLQGSSSDDVSLGWFQWLGNVGETGGAALTINPPTLDWTLPNIVVHEDTQIIWLKTFDRAGNEGEELAALVPTLPKVTDLSVDSELNWPAGSLPSLTLEATVTAEAGQNLSEVRWSTSAGEFGSVPVAPPSPQATVTIPNLTAEPLVPLFITAEAVDSEGVISRPYTLSTNEFLSHIECKKGEGDPVDTATGAQLHSETLIGVQGLLPIAFTLQYSSLTLRQTPFGRGWTDALYSARLENRSGGEIRVHWNDLKHNDFLPQGGGLYRSTADACFYSELTLNQDGSYTLRRQNNTVYEFDSHGILQKLGNHRDQFVELSYLNGALHRITDPIGGVWLEYGYDNATGRVNSISDSQGRQAILHHEDDGDLDYFIDAAGFQTTYTYNEQGQALTGVNAEGDQLFRNTYGSDGRVETQDDGRLDNQLLRFTYDNSGLPNQSITTVTDRLGKLRIYTYDGAGRLVNERDELGHDQQFTYYPDGKVATQTDENQHTTQYTYDAKGNLDIVTDPATFTTDYDYDNENNLVQLTNARGQLEGYSTTWTYDPVTNNLLSVNDNASHVTRYTYTPAGQLETMTLPRTGVTVYGYDTNSKGQPASMLNPEGVLETYGYDNAGNRTSATVTGFTTLYGYDGLNRVSSLQPAGLPATTYQYNSRGLVTQRVDGRGTATDYIYDRNGNRTEQRITVEGVVQITRYDYDGKDRLIKVTDPKGHETRFEYDDNDRLLISFNGENEARRFVYDPADNLLETYDALDRLIEARTYDNRDNLDLLTDALNRSTDHDYDELSRLITQTLVSDPLNRETDFSYDTLDRLTSVIDANSQLSQQLFDGDGNRDWVEDPNHHQTDFNYDLADRQTVDDDPSAAPVELSYDTRGLLETRTNGRNQVQTYGYDDAGRLTSLSDPVSHLSLTLDANGNIETLSDSSAGLSSITRQFDELNRVTQYTDSQGQMIGYDYDLAGNLEVLTYPDGRTVRYGYDDANRLTSVTDWDNRTTTYVYDAVGRLDRIDHHNGSRQEVDFDVAGQLTRLEEQDGLGNTIREYSYSGYDHLGLPATETVSPPLLPFALPDVSLSVDAGNKLLAVNGQSVQHDADGNLTQVLLAGQTAALSFDARNRLTQVDTTSYTYDGEDQRISRTDNDQTTQFITSPHGPGNLSRVLVKINPDGSQTYYVYGLGLIAQETVPDGQVQGEYLTYHYDRRGSTIALTDDQGHVTARMRYSPFGQVQVIGQADTPFLYNGRDGVQTEPNGLYYMRARYYHPEIRRFVNRDVLRGSLAQAQSLNRYAFVEGNPVVFVDPEGLQRQTRAEAFAELGLQDPSARQAQLARSVAEGFSDTADVIDAIAMDTVESAPYTLLGSAALATLLQKGEKLYGLICSFFGKKSFKNLAPDDEIGIPKLLDFSRIQSQKISGSFNFVVDESGKLIIGKRFNFPGGGHIDLAGGKPVQSAGQVKFVKGKIKVIDNKSGHYQTNSKSARNAALKAFDVDDINIYKDILK